MEPELRIPPERRVWPNRTLNLRGIRAIGYDMDYTLVPYVTAEWERAAFDHARAYLDDKGWPVEDTAFDPQAVTQGLVFDLETGNLCKATRFGYVIKAAHGTRPLGYEELRTTYSGVSIDLSDSRWQFTNTMFSLSQSSLYAQMVDKLDSGKLKGVMGYDDLYLAVGGAIDHVHRESELKPGILADPDRFIDPDPGVVDTILDQRAAGKTVMMITNSDWGYSDQVMKLAVEPYMPDGASWRDLFDLVIVSARKPVFFTSQQPAFRLVDEQSGLMEAHMGPLAKGEIYVGGDARMVETSFGLSGDELLYVGDHLFGDIHVTKNEVRWRTALIVRELEDEITDAETYVESERRLVALMGHKEALERQHAVARLARLRARTGRGDGPDQEELDTITDAIAVLDDAIGPLAKGAGELTNSTWGPIMRAGIDKSLFARQVERYADVYTSRVSNFELATPYAYLRAPRSDLPHDHRSGSAMSPFDDGGHG